MATQFRRLFALKRSQYWFLLIESIGACHILNNCQSHCDLICVERRRRCRRWHPSITHFGQVFCIKSSRTYLRSVPLGEFVASGVVRQWRTRWQMSVAANSWRLSKSFRIDEGPFLQIRDTEVEEKYLGNGNHDFYDAPGATTTLSMI